MELDKKNFLIDSKKKIIDALNLIQKNQCGICFVTKNNKVIKSVTDGDIRRMLENEGSDWSTLKAKDIMCDKPKLSNGMSWQRRH